MQKLWSSSSPCSFLQFPVTSCLPGPNIFLSTVFLNILSLHSYLNVYDHISNEKIKWNLCLHWSTCKIKILTENTNHTAEKIQGSHENRNQRSTYKCTTHSTHNYLKQLWTKSFIKSTTGLFRNTWLRSRQDSCQYNDRGRLLRIQSPIPRRSMIFLFSILSRLGLGYTLIAIWWKLNDPHLVVEEL